MKNGNYEGKKYNWTSSYEFGGDDMFCRQNKKTKKLELFDLKHHTMTTKTLDGKVKRTKVRDIEKKLERWNEAFRKDEAELI